MASLETHTAKPPQSNPISYSEAFFGGVLKVKEKLVDAVHTALHRSTMSPDELNFRCGFGEAYSKDNRILPKIEEVLADKSKMSSLVFSLASGPLHLTLDKVLSVDPKHPASKAALHHMKTERLGVVAGAGGGDVSDISKKEQLQLFVLMQVMDEIG